MRIGRKYGVCAWLHYAPYVIVWMNIPLKDRHNWRVVKVVSDVWRSERIGKKI